MMQEFHFDVGNSSTGPLGLCASIVADGPGEAVGRLRNLLGLQGDGTISLPTGSGKEYIHIYLNPDAIRETHIDEVRPVTDTKPR